MSKSKPEGQQGRIAPYPHAAAGWGAVKQVAVTLVQEKVAGGKFKTLLAQNQPDGFDCPGCAWPDREHQSTFQFCENGVKAVAAEATSKRVTAEFFARHTVTELMEQSDYALEQHGRLTEPMVYDRASDKYLPLSWDAAFAQIARHLKALPDPNQASFYTSGRTGNEAAFLFQLFVRLYGTNNFPDCSNMCHEPTSRGLPGTVGTGKGTVTLEDFEHADTLIIFGQNPATNHPRMLTELRDAARRGATIVSVNPLRERGLERFTSPSHAMEMITNSSTSISSMFVQPRVGGDFALIKALAKRLLELDDAALAAGQPRLLDLEFMAEHTTGFEEFSADLRAQDWQQLLDESGVARDQIERLAQIYARGQRVIATWGMGLTQHKGSVKTIQMLSNLLMMRGHIGRKGAGLCPVRGHSNVQGDRTMGIEDKPTKAFLDRMQKVFDFEPPRQWGYDTVDTIQAMLDKKVKVFFSMGGNFAMATPDTPATFRALRSCDLVVNVATKLNRSHLVFGQESILLPTLGRTEVDLQGGVAQGVTVEDSMSMVHLSYGRNEPASPQLLSETVIVARLAHATLGSAKIDWNWYAADYARIRDLIAQVFDDFHDFNTRVAKPGGFHLRVASRERDWRTASGKAPVPAVRGRYRHADPPRPPALRRAPDDADHLPLARPVQHHHLRHGRPLSRRVRHAPGGLHQPGRPGPAGTTGRPVGRPDQRVGRWRGAPRRALYSWWNMTFPRGCLGAYFPETNPLVPPAQHRRWRGDAHLQVDSRLLSPAP